MNITISNTGIINPENFEYSFKTKFDHTIRFYDDSDGPFWIAQNSYGISAIIRARSFDVAWDIYLDEFADRVPLEDIHEAYGFDTKEEFDAVEDKDTLELSECYYHMPNSSGTSGIVSLDLNGETLDELTVEYADTLELKIFITLGK